MPQWRKLHTKILQSDDLHEMPDDFTRLVWTYLPLILDREGRCPDNTSLVKSRVMPMREDVTPERMGQALDWFAGRGMIVRYSVNGRHYFYVPTFRQYQGDTRKETDSVLPAPLGTVPGTVPTPELVESKSSTDADADADAESDTLGADAPLSPPGVGDVAKPKRSPSAADIARGKLADHFWKATAIKEPAPTTDKGKKEAATFWWNPLREILKLCSGDVSEAERLIGKAIRHMRENGLTIAAPNSILKVAISIYGEEHSPQGQARAGPPPGGAFGGMKGARLIMPGKGGGDG